MRWRVDLVGGRRDRCATYPAIAEEFTHQYRAEVGYYEAGALKWHIGSPTTREKCTSEVTALYNRYYRDDPGRAYSWACLEVSGDRVIRRVR